MQFRIEIRPKAARVTTWGLVALCVVAAGCGDDAVSSSGAEGAGGSATASASGSSGASSTGASSAQSSATTTSSSTGEGGAGGEDGVGAGGAGGAGGGPVDFDACDDPLIQPPGWVAVNESWVTISWEPVQSNPPQGYAQPRPAESMFIGISRCPGDLRPSDLGASGNPWLQDGCRRSGGGASLIHRTTGEPSDDYTCQVEAGVVHYLTVAAVQPADGLTEGEHTCSEIAPNSALGCDVEVIHTAVVQ